MQGFDQDSENRWTASRIGAVAMFTAILAVWGLLAWRFGLLVAFLAMCFLASCIQLPLYFYKGIVIPLIRGTQCPACHGWSLHKVAEVAFGYRYFECSDCGQRCKRYDMDSPWWEASSFEDETAFKPEALDPHRSALRLGHDPKRPAYLWVPIILALGVGSACLFPVMHNPGL